MNQVFFSPGTDCSNAIIENLLKAEKSVKICVFTISDNRIVGAIKQLQQRGIKIKIISDNDKRFDRGNDIEYLAKRGIAVKVDKTSAHMHHKFAVIDNKVAITGSYNWTKSAELYNQENILITDNKKIVKPYVSEFNKLWSEFELVTEKMEQEKTNLKENKDYIFEVLKTEIIDKEEYFILQDPYGKKHSILSFYYKNYDIKPSQKIKCFIDKINCRGQIFIEPEHPHYKRNHKFKFKFVKHSTRITKQEKKIHVIEVEDIYGNTATVLPNNKFQESENYKPESIECIVKRIKKGRLYINNLDK